MSGEISGRPADVRAITDDARAEESGVPHAAALLAFAEAVVAGSDAVLQAAQRDLLEAVGPEAFVDAAGVVGNFQRMVRIADGTGIPLDAPVMALTEGMRGDLGLGGFASARHTRPLGRTARALSRVLAPVSSPLIRWMGRRYRG